MLRNHSSNNYQQSYRRPPSPQQARYISDQQFYPKTSNERFDWQKNSNNVHNEIRGTTQQLRKSTAGKWESLIENNYKEQNFQLKRTNTPSINSQRVIQTRYQLEMMPNKGIKVFNNVDISNNETRQEQKHENGVNQKYTANLQKYHANKENNQPFFVGQEEDIDTYRPKKRSEVKTRDMSSRVFDHIKNQQNIEQKSEEQQIEQPLQVEEPKRIVQRNQKCPSQQAVDHNERINVNQEIKQKLQNGNNLMTLNNKFQESEPSKPAFRKANSQQALKIKDGNRDYWQNIKQNDIWKKEIMIKEIQKKENIPQVSITERPQTGNRSRNLFTSQIAFF